MAIYDINGNIITGGDSVALETKTLLSYGLDRITKLEGLQSEFTVPVLKLYGDTSKMTKDKAVNLTAEYSDGVRSFSCIANTKWQGQTSLNLDKKNFNVKLVDSHKNKYITSFKDWFPTNKYHFKANYTEPSLVRNSVGSRLGRIAYPNLYPNNAKGSVDSFPFALYINDVFWGCYTWNLPQNADLFSMNEEDKNHMVFRSNNEGWTMANFEDRMRDDPTEYSLEQLERMYDWSVDCTVQEFHDEVEDYFDLDSLLYYWCVVEMECGTDSMCNNATWASWDGGNKWYVLWYDTDLIFGCSSILTATPTLDLIAATKTGQFTYKYNPIFDKLLSAYYDELCDVYAKLRDTIFTDATTIIRYFTDYRDQWGSEYLTLERAKWPPRNPSLDINLCGDFITQRLAYCDNKYGYTP